MLIIVMINTILLMLLQYLATDVQPEPVSESHDPTATSEEQPWPTNNSNEQDVPTSLANDGVAIATELHNML